MVKRKLAKVATVTAMAGLVFSLVGCGSSSSQQASSGNGGKPVKKAWKIALSNSYIGNSWRSEMVKIFEGYAKQKKAEGIISDYYVSSSGNDPQAQINEIRNMMSKGYNAILVDAASPTALAPVLNEAAKRGIVVVAFDNTVDSNKVYNVNTDQVQFGEKQAQWLADQMHGKGNILELNGVEGTTVDRDRQKGYENVLKKYPGIHVLQKGYGKWDDAATSIVINNMLNAEKGQGINGILTQGGGENAIYQALKQNNLDPTKIPMTGEMTNGFFRHMKEDGVKGIGVGQPPYLSAASLDVALDVLNGKKVEKTVMIPLPVGTYKNVDKFYAKGQPDNFFVDWTNADNTYKLKLADVLPKK
ncbi:substrate-binding domain-containing protein [Fodinisporobacter ferrooxydans]|uniref:Substrate-binding domain-containing protein n=1 Tax=Fodinisporobacter ferrooxydans TaxID=2901836 RepID=A0ABY4CQE5_9BACL|nr:substrate-binding domain-containing protein [Alicyclobacillaceae bacterium MYW30-H2]